MTMLVSGYNMSTGERPEAMNGSLYAGKLKLGEHGLLGDLSERGLGDTANHITSTIWFIILEPVRDLSSISKC